MRLFLSVIFMAISAGCGDNNATIYLNENPPTGTVIFQGQFLVPGVNVSGTAQIYNSAGKVVLRMQGLNTPQDTRYFFYLEQSGNATAVYVTQLKAAQGNHNYATGLNVGPTFTRVVFRGNTNPMSPEISSANLVAVP